MNTSFKSLPFKEQIHYLQGKLNLPTHSWTDIYNSEHDQAFVVAGAIRRELLADLRGAVEKAIAKGTTLEQFRKDFDRTVITYGWQYKGERGWRTNVIWETNLRQSYNAGREAQTADPELRKQRPYGLYQHGDSRHPRPEHQSWDNTVLPLDDPWWATHTPQNGWGCKCKKFMLSQRDVERRGLKVTKAPAIEWEDRVIGQNSPNGPRTVRVPKGIDPGFEHAPGRSRLINYVPPLRAHDPLPELDGKPTSAHGAGLPNRRPSLPPLPPRQVAAARLLPPGLTDQQYVGRFLGEFGASEQTPVLFKDVTGDGVVIGPQMFTVKKTGKLKVQKRGREQTLLLVAQALREPDEVWVRLEWLYAQQKAVVRRRYLARFDVEGKPAPALAVFEVGSDGWDGVTGFVADSEAYLEELRLGVLLYRRE